MTTIDPRSEMGGGFFGGGLFGRRKRSSPFDFEDMQQPTGPTDYGAMQPGQGMQQPRKRSVLPYILAVAEDTAARQMGYRPQGVARLNQRDDEERFFQQRAAEQQRQRAAALADYRAKLGIEAEFAQPEAPKPGSFEWYQTASPEQRALFDQFDPVVVATGQGPVAVPRGSFGGIPTAPVGKLTPIEPTTQNTPAPGLSASGLPTSLTREQYEAVVNARGKAETDDWMRRHNIRVTN